MIFNNPPLFILFFKLLKAIVSTENYMFLQFQVNLQKNKETEKKNSHKFSIDWPVEG